MEGLHENASDAWGSGLTRSQARRVSKEKSVVNPPRLPTVAAALLPTVARGWQTSPEHQQASVVPGGYA